MNVIDMHCDTIAQIYRTQNQKETQRLLQSLRIVYNLQMEQNMNIEIIVFIEIMKRYQNMLNHFHLKKSHM